MDGAWFVAMFVLVFLVDAGLRRWIDRDGELERSRAGCFYEGCVFKPLTLVIAFTLAVAAQLIFGSR